MKNLSQLLCSLKSAQKARKQKLTLPFSKLTWVIIRILLLNGYIEGSILWKNKVHVFLKPGVNKGIQGIQQISRSGRRMFASHKGLTKVSGGLGLLIISTPKGVYTSQQAQKHRLGGELLCRLF